jgi:hypothetical protein
MAFSFSSLLNPKPSALAPNALQEQANTLSVFKAQALTAARDKIAKRNKETGNQDLPTLEDYRAAFMANGDALQQMGITPNSEQANRMAANLSGQTIEGFLISEPPERATTDFFNQDSDGAISTFHSEVNLTGASLKNCFVDPATTFNEELAEAKSLENVTFNNLADDDKFCLGNGGKSTARFKDIHITNSHGGSITLDGATVNGMTISGNHITELNLKNGASINGLTASAGIFKLNGEAGTSVNNSNFTNTTFSLAGSAAGISFTNVTFTNITGLDLSGATLRNVRVGDDLITSPEQLTALGVTVDDTTTIAASTVDPSLSQPAQMAAASPSPFDMLMKGMEGLTLPKLAVDPNVDFNSIAAATVPITAEVTAQKAAQPAMSTDYFKKMSEGGALA